jgi:hypothetical protein
MPHLDNSNIDFRDWHVKVVCVCVCVCVCV